MNKFPRTAFTVAAFLICLVTGLTTAAAQVAQRLNADLAAGEEVGLFRVLQDGSVSYEAGFGWGGDNEAWHVTLGQMPTLLSDGQGRGRVSYATFSAMSPDGAYVYFEMRPLSDPYSFFSDLYRMPVGGGVPEAVLEREPAGALEPINHYSIGFSPDQSEFLYLSDVEQPGIRELYARSLANGVTRRVTPPRPSNGSLQPGYVRITPDGSNVVFSTHFDGAWHRELWTAPLAGGAATQLNAGLPTVYYLTANPFTASGDEVLFHSSVGAYRSPIAGGAPTLLSAPIRTTDLNVAPNGERIAYRQTDNLYGVAATGGPVVQYTDDGGFPHYYSPLFFTPNGERLIYADLSSPERVLSVASAGGSSINLTSNHPSTTNFQFVQLIDNAAGDLGVLYQTYPDIGVNAPHEIYRVGLDGTGRQRLNMPLGPTDAIETGSFAQTRDGEFLVFGIVEKARHSFNEAAYYMTPIEGGPIVRITPELPAMASIKQWELSQDGSRFYFTADSRVVGTDELFLTGLPMDRLDPGGDVHAKVNGGLALVGGVYGTFEEVQTRGIFTATYTPGLIPLEFGSAPGAFHQWELDFTGQVVGDAALTFRYAAAGLQAASLDPTPTVYVKSSGGGWSSVDPGLVAFQPGQFTVNLSGVNGMTIGLAVSSIPEPTSLLLAPLAALGMWAVGRGTRLAACERR